MTATAVLNSSQLNIARLIAEGLTASEISVHLGLSPHTIHTHMATIRVCFSVHSREHIILAARRVEQDELLDIIRSTTHLTDVQCRIFKMRIEGLTHLQIGARLERSWRYSKRVSKEILEALNCDGFGVALVLLLEAADRPVQLDSVESAA